MTGYDIALSLALGTVALALQRSIPLRRFAWRHAPARLPLAAQSAMVVVLVAGLLWGPDERKWALLLACWMGGILIGDIVQFLRPRAPQDVHAETND